LEQVGDVLGQGEPHRVRQLLSCREVQDGVGGPGPVGADQHLAPDPGTRAVTGQLAQGVLDHLDVARGGVRPGDAGAQQDAKRFTGASQCPRPLARRRAGSVSRPQRRRHLASQGGDGPRDRRIRGHRSVAAGFGAQQRDVGQVVPAQGQGDREVQENHGRVMDRRRPAPQDQPHRQLAAEPGRHDGLGQQHPTGLTDRPRRSRVDLDAGVEPGRLLHLEGARRTG